MSSGDWVSAVDPNTGRTYYVNYATKETSWDPPPNSQSSSSSANGIVSSSVGSTNINTHATPQEQQWELRYDESTGRPFYIDHINKVTTWDRPSNFDAQFDSGSRGGGEINIAQKQHQQQQHAKPGYHSSAPVSYTAAPSPYPSSVGNSGTANGGSHSVGMESDEALARRLQEEEDNAVALSLAEEDENSARDRASSVDNSSVEMGHFQVRMVPDDTFPNCQSCAILFSNLRRRHHCRLCGNLFCESCSKKKVMLPLDGKEFSKPVRVCNGCNKEVERENYFSLRRYAVALSLPRSTENEKRASEKHLISAMKSFREDLEQLLLNPPDPSEDGFISPLTALDDTSKFLGNLGSCCSSSRTTDRMVADCSMSLLASILSVSSLLGEDDLKEKAGKNDDIVNAVLSTLETGVGVDNEVKTHAAKSLFYMTETAAGGEGSDGAAGKVKDKLNIPLTRSLAAILDNVTSPDLPLQRWCAASVRNLLLRDDKMLKNLLDVGGILVLGSLLSSTDADTQAHAASSLVTALQLSDYGVDILKGISDCVDFPSAVPSILDPVTTDMRMVETSLVFVQSLLRRIFHPDRTKPPAPIFFSPCYQIGKKMFCAEVMRALLQVARNRKEHKRAVIDIVAAIYECGHPVKNLSDGSELSLVCRQITEVVLEDLSAGSTSALDNETKKRIGGILSGCPPRIGSGGGSKRTLGVLLGHGMLSAAAGLLRDAEGDRRELLFAALDANIVSHVSQFFGSIVTTSGAAPGLSRILSDEFATHLKLLHGLAKTAYGEEVDGEAAQRFTDCFFHFAQNNLTGKLVNTLEIAVSNIPLDDSKQEADVDELIALLIELLNLLSSTPEGLEEITQSLYLSDQGSNVVCTLLISKNEVIVPLLELTARITAACRPALIERLSAGSYLSVVVDIFSNFLTIGQTNEAHFLHCMDIVNSMAPTAPPSAHLTKACSIISQAVNKTGDQRVKKECMHTLVSLSKNANNWGVISEHVFPALADILLTGGINSPNDDGLQTSALKIIKFILPLPANAEKAATSGIVLPLINLISAKGGCTGEGREALEVLKAMAASKESVIAVLNSQGALGCVCKEVLRSSSDADGTEDRTLAIDLLIKLINDRDPNSFGAIVEAITGNLGIVSKLRNGLGKSLEKNFNLRSGIFAEVWENADVYANASPGDADALSGHVEELLWVLLNLFCDERMKSSPEICKFWSSLDMDEQLIGGSGSDKNICTLALCGKLLRSTASNSSPTAASNYGLVRHKLISCASRIIIGNGYQIEIETILEECNFFSLALQNNSELLISLVSNYPELCVREFMNNKQTMEVVVNGLSNANDGMALTILNEAIKMDVNGVGERLSACGLRPRAISVLCSLINTCSAPKAPGSSSDPPTPTSPNLELHCMNCLVGIVGDSMNGKEACQIADNLSAFLSQKIMSAVDSGQTISGPIYDIAKTLMGKKEALTNLVRGGMLKGIVGLTLNEGGDEMRKEALDFLLKACVCSGGGIEVVIAAGGEKVCVSVLKNRSDDKLTIASLQLLARLVKGKDGLVDECWDGIAEALDIIVGVGEANLTDACMKLIEVCCESNREARGKVLCYNGFVQSLCDDSENEAKVLFLSSVSREIDLKMKGLVGKKCVGFLAKTRLPKCELMNVLMGVQHVLKEQIGVEERQDIVHGVCDVVEKFLSSNSDRDGSGAFESFLTLMLLRSDFPFPSEKERTLVNNLVKFVNGLDTLDRKEGYKEAKLFAVQILLCKVDEGVLKGLLDGGEAKSFQRQVQKIGGSVAKLCPPLL